MPAGGLCGATQHEAALSIGRSVCHVALENFYLALREGDADPVFLIRIPKCQINIPTDIGQSASSVPDPET